MLHDTVSTGPSCAVHDTDTGVGGTLGALKKYRHSKRRRDAISAKSLQDVRLATRCAAPVHCDQNQRLRV